MSVNLTNHCQAPGCCRSSQNSEGAGFLLLPRLKSFSSPSPYLLKPAFLPPLFFLLFLNYFTGLALNTLKTSYSISLTSIYVTCKIICFNYAIAFSLLQSVIQTAILSNYGFKFITSPATKFSGICSPIMARSKSSQYFEVWDLGIFNWNLAPSFNYGSSHTGLIPFTNTCKLVPYGIAVGRRMCW